MNGWVAIESLLVDSNENHGIGAERMARVVAASYFRTEMDWLARYYTKLYKDQRSVAEEIDNTDTSIERGAKSKRVVYLPFNRTNSVTISGTITGPGLLLAHDTIS